MLCKHDVMLKISQYIICTWYLTVLIFYSPVVLLEHFKFLLVYCPDIYLSFIRHSKVTATFCTAILFCITMASVVVVMHQPGVTAKST